MTKLYHIQISQYFELTSKTELFSVLEQLLPIKFFLGKKNGIEPDGVVASDSEANSDAAITHSLSFSSPIALENKSLQIETEVKFADDIDVPFPFRGRSVKTKLSQVGAFLSLKNNEKILAATTAGPIWAILEIAGIKHFRSALPLPHISGEQNFNDVFNGQCFLEMLVFLQFIREISQKTSYQSPPLRASFIIDDPNLHWSSYGFVDYRETIARAEKENYHVAFATIPLDTWYTHRATADLFRKYPQRLSLLIHGNNHAKEELVLNYPNQMRKALLGQAIERIKHLEQKANLRISRVMVPPHGACSDKMLGELPKFGFEAACISAGSLRAHNKDKQWTKTLGFFPSEIIKGCPVLPRWGLTGNVENTLLVAAYLGQPLILRGHHQDFKDGGLMFDKFARFINSLGEVFWSNINDLSRLNYLWRIEGTRCYVKPLSNNICFKPPREATEIIIESFAEISNCTWQIISSGGIKKLIPGESFSLSEEIGNEIYIERKVSIKNSHALKSFKPTSIKLILRRLLTEARDRLLV
jgi:hypothetical protein